MGQDLMNAVYAFSEERDWHQFHSTENLAKSISIEAGELLECYTPSSSNQAEKIALHEGCGNHAMQT